MGQLTAHWSFDLALVYVVLAGGMYALGGVGQRRSRDHGKERLRELSFASGLAIIVIALDSPIDYYSDLLFWVHMVQHILLLTVAPPLILLGRPWPRMWKSLPMSWRTKGGRTIAKARWTAPIRFVARPGPAFVVFSLNFLLWHIPAAYNAALNFQWIHDAEHALFFFTGLLFWAHVVDPGPIRKRLDWMRRAGYIVGGMIVGWVLAIALVIAKTPLYAHYAALSHRPGGISVMVDQQLAGGMMWVPGSLVYVLAVLIVFGQWLGMENEPSAGRAAPAL